MKKTKIYAAKEDPSFMVFCLDENDNEASFFGEPLAPNARQ